MTTVFSEKESEEIRDIYDTLKEVETRSFSETLGMLEKDRESGTGNSFGMWKQIASAYSQMLDANPDFTIDQKFAVYEVILRLTTGFFDPSAIHGLDKDKIKDAEEIFSQTVYPHMQNLK